MRKPVALAVTLCTALWMGPVPSYAAPKRAPSPLYSSAIGASTAMLLHLGIGLALTRPQAPAAPEGPILVDEYGTRYNLTPPTMQLPMNRGATTNFAAAGLHAGLALLLYAFGRLDALVHPTIAMHRRGLRLTARKGGLGWQGRF